MYKKQILSKQSMLLKNMRGITLISLVTSIIVLLIISTISIAIITNSGIIDKAQDASVKCSDSTVEEKIRLALAEYQIKSDTSNYLDKTKQEYLQDSLNKLFNSTVSVKKMGLNYRIEIEGNDKIFTLRYDGTIRIREKSKPMKTTGVYAKLDEDGTLYLRATQKSGYVAYSSSASIGQANRSSVLKVIIEESIVPANTISMFYSCDHLASIENIENLHMQNVTDMRSMFYCCKAIQNLDVTNFDTSNVTNMSSLFNRCTGLKSLDVSNFDTSKVTNMSNMFVECTQVPELDISNFNTDNVTDMNYMFSSCTSLKTVNISVLDTSKVTNMKNMFYACTNLKEIDVSGFDTSKVTNMANMFNRCRNVLKLDVSNFNTDNVEDMNNMFYECKVIDYLNLNRFNTSNVTNMKGMLGFCSKLKKIDLSTKFKIQDNTNIDDMFKNTPNSIIFKTTGNVAYMLKQKFSNFTDANFDIVEN